MPDHVVPKEGPPKVSAPIMTVRGSGRLQVLELVLCREERREEEIGCGLRCRLQFDAIYDAADHDERVLRERSGPVSGTHSYRIWIVKASTAYIDDPQNDAVFLCYCLGRDSNRQLASFEVCNPFLCSPCIPYDDMVAKGVTNVEGETDE